MFQIHITYSKEPITPLPGSTVKFDSKWILQYSSDVCVYTININIQAFCIQNTKHM